MSQQEWTPEKSAETKQSLQSSLGKQDQGLSGQVVR